jgi:predicted ferric reductase
MSQALWYASRGTGLVSLILVTATTILGLLGTSRSATAGTPRFVLAALHRNLALITPVFLLVHIASAIIDPYAGIGWLDAVLPFVSSYEPLWVGLGAVALDLLIAIVVTSLLRSRMTRRGWRTIHLTSYALWPIVVIHGLGDSGADSRRGWVLALYALCALGVAVALVRRLTAAHPDAEVRAAAAGRWR